jgi:hypothetical protein
MGECKIIIREIRTSTEFKNLKLNEKNVSRIRKKTFYLLVNFTFLGSHDFRLHFRPHKVYYFEFSIKFLIDG